MSSVDNIGTYGHPGLLLAFFSFDIGYTRISESLCSFDFYTEFLFHVIYSSLLVDKHQIGMVMNAETCH